ncbi:MAG: glycosyltransferase [Alphaproteobacteria bacterium]|nr:MAG: glycosyltransferase [Alphaproteobacteria bacterium]
MGHDRRSAAQAARCLRPSLCPGRRRRAAPRRPQPAAGAMTPASGSGADRRADVLIYVQHLLGTGHLVRTAAIAAAAAAAGLSVVVASGGLPLPGLRLGGARLVQLPPARAADETFAALVDEAGRVVDEAWRMHRRARLIDLFRATRPRVLVTEMFPFGRRLMRFELLPLLECARAVRPRPRIVCSLRDVLTTHRTPGKTAWILDTFARFYDLALVHGDPAFLPLECSFPAATRIAAHLRYTGYVAASAPPAARDGSRDCGRGEVVVSAGGGAVAAPLATTAVAARAHAGPLSTVPWRVLIGSGLPEPAFQSIRAAAPAGVIVTRARPDFPALLARARLSISQAGYNTALDVLRAGVPALFVPYAARGETEQSLRARALARIGVAGVLDPAELAPEALARAAMEAAARPPVPLHLHLDGAAQSARILRALAQTVPA